LLIGGNGTQVLRLGARCADIVSLSGLGRTLEDGHRHEAQWSEAAITERVGVVRNASRAPTRPILDALVQYARITDDRDTAAERLAQFVPGPTPVEILGAPYALLGTLEELAAEILQHHETWGFTSYVVRESVLDDAAALIDCLRSA
jgi:hypothetical protein